MGPAEENQFYCEHIAMVVRSYYQLTGKQIGVGMLRHQGLDLAADSAFAQSLFNAPFALISHGTEAEPRFNYANKTAMKLFNMTWDEITNLQSRYSAEQPSRVERMQLLNEVKAKGYIENYSGVRIAQGGRRFCIEQACVWNLTDNDGHHRGQAAMFSDWHYL